MPPYHPLGSRRDSQRKKNKKKRRKKWIKIGPRDAFTGRADGRCLFGRLNEGDHSRSCGATDNASDYGSEDSRFESWQDRELMLLLWTVAETAARGLPRRGHGARG